MMQIRFAADFKMRPDVPENYPDYAREVANLVKNDADIQLALKEGWPEPDDYRMYLYDKNDILTLKKKDENGAGSTHPATFKDGTYNNLDWYGTVRKGFFRAEPLKKFILRRIGEGKELAFELFSAAQSQKDLKEDFKEFL